MNTMTATEKASWVQVRDGVLRPGGTFWVSRHGRVYGPFTALRLTGGEAFDGDRVPWAVEQCFVSELEAREDAAARCRKVYAERKVALEQAEADMERTQHDLTRLAARQAVLA